MFALFWLVIAVATSAFKSRRVLTLENLALRQQVALLKRSVKRPRVTTTDRIFWCVLAHFVQGWRNYLYALHPDTVVRWHKAGFRKYWTWKSRRIGRPRIDPELRDLIRTMQSENRTWGAPRIHGELLKLDYHICEATVSKYMKRHWKPPSQSWRTFLANHSEVIAAIDFFTVHTATFRILYVFVVIEHGRRRVVHFNVTSSPTAQWTAQQIVEAFPFDTAPRYLVRDNDGIYGAAFRRRVRSLHIKDVPTTPRSPWQNPIAERIIGTLRRECLNHVIVSNERHLRRLLKEYVDYYHRSRTHLSLDKDPPEPRDIESRTNGNVVSFPVLGGLHHRYSRVAA